MSAKNDVKWALPYEFDGFRIVSQIGRGGMGAVYLAEELRLGRNVAVKVLWDPTPDRRQRQRFIREARAVARLAHPNIVAVYRVGEIEERLYIVYEYIDGAALSTLAIPIEWPRALEIGLEVARAVAVTHAAGIVHRDIKPGNVMLAPDGTVKLIDFGLAKRASEPEVIELLGPATPATTPDPKMSELPTEQHSGRFGEEPTVANPQVEPEHSITATGDKTITEAGAVLGTPMYMAPEQFHGVTTERSDIYSLGATLYALCAGRSPRALAASKGSDPPRLDELVADIHPGFSEVIRRCIANDPEERFSNADVLVAALNRIAADARRTEELLDGERPTARGFFGRETELLEMQELLSAGARLVTVLGMGGVGKTRLCRVFAPDALWCELAHARSVADICVAVARALEIPLATGDETVSEQIGRALAAWSGSLVILDNFEQIAGFAHDTVGRWMALAPGVQFIATSRQPLGVAGEQTYKLAPLRVPPSGKDGGLAGYEAVQLFIARASEVSEAPRLTRRDMPVVGEIVRRLDGIPLAIELAAARCDVLEPASILERLNQRFALLKRGPSESVERQGTLYNAIDWSWELLSDAEKEALARTSVFRGFSLEAAERVVAHPDVIDLLQSLQQKSLIWSTRDLATGERRFDLYESVRAYAALRLATVEGHEAIHHRHAEYYLEICEAWAAQAYTRDASNAITQIARELDNLAAIVDRANRNSDAAAMAVRAAVAADAATEVLGPHGQQHALVSRALEAARRHDIEPELLAQGLHARARASQRLGRLYDAESDLREAIELVEGLDLADQRQVYLLVDLATVQTYLGEVASARELLDRAEALTSSRAVRARAYVTGNRGVLEEASGDPERAIALCEEARTLARRCGDLRHAALFSNNAGVAQLRVGRLAAAEESFARAATALEALGDRHAVGVVLANRGLVLIERGDLGRATEYLELARHQARAEGDQGLEGIWTGELGRVAIEEGDISGARTSLWQSLELLAGTGKARERATFAAFLAASHALDGDSETAASRLETIGREAQELGDPSLIRLVEILVGLVSVEAGDAGALSAASELCEASEAQAETSEYVRSAVRYLRRRIGD